MKSIITFTAVILIICITYNASAVNKSHQIILGEHVEVIQITDNIWMHISKSEYPGYGLVSANGMIVCDDTYAVIVDTPWNDSQTSILCDWITTVLKKKIQYTVPTHSHEDCMGGIGEIKKRGITTVALEMTKQIAERNNLILPDLTFSEKQTLKIGNIMLELYWPGGGHSKDNITVWEPSEKVLFAGCILKTSGAKSLGNTKEADMENWADSVKILKQIYPNPDVIIPGHGKPGTRELYDHTLSLF